MSKKKLQIKFFFMKHSAKGKKFLFQVKKHKLDIFSFFFIRIDKQIFCNTHHDFHCMHDILKYLIGLDLWDLHYVC